MNGLACPQDHCRDLRKVTVRVGDGTHADQIEVERERFDGAGQPVEVVRANPPVCWTEDYTAAEVRGPRGVAAVRG